MEECVRNFRTFTVLFLIIVINIKISNQCSFMMHNLSLVFKSEILYVKVSDIVGRRCRVSQKKTPQCLKLRETKTTSNDSAEKKKNRYIVYVQSKQMPPPFGLCPYGNNTWAQLFKASLA